jgi:hypothetical protein
MIEIFDTPLCCPTGLCGPTVDQTLLDVNELVFRLQVAGMTVERYQMSTQPHKFTSNTQVMSLLQKAQMAALPITALDGQVIKSGSYPTWEELQTYLQEGAS